MRGLPEEEWTVTSITLNVTGDSGYWGNGFSSPYDTSGSEQWGGTDYNPLPGSNSYRLQVHVDLFQFATQTMCSIEPDEIVRTVELPDDEEDPPGEETPTLLLDACQELYPDQSVSALGYTFIYQLDGNLVLYSGGTPIWASETDGTSPGRAIMQCDGNLVVYDASETPLWDSGTAGHAGAYLGIMGNGVLQIVGDGEAILWSSR